MPSQSRIVSVALGILLLATAGFKLYGLRTPGMPTIGWLENTWAVLAAGEWELVLGAWLLCGVTPRISWLGALLTFITFAVISGYLGWVGVASCGCLGAVKANPWWLF